MLALVLTLTLALAAPPAPDLRTTAERTGYERTGRYDEAVALCRAYAEAFPARARCTTFGRTPEGRELVALAASADGTLDPAAAKARRRQVVLFQGGIHAGEIDGKDAGFAVLRELLQSKDGGPLARITAVFVPVLNADGHERFGPNERPNQRGPAETGWRTTAWNLNLNRDYVKADAPEMQALLDLLGAWDPIAYADLHVTDGAKFQHDAGILVEPRNGYAEPLRPEGKALSDALLARLTAAGHLPVDFYPEFETPGDPRTGFGRHVSTPAFSDTYWAARNRLGILLETHSWRTYRERVRTTADFLRALLDLAAERGARWRTAAERSDWMAAASAGRAIPIRWEPQAPEAGGRVETIDFRGYAYAFEDSVVTGEKVVRYDEGKPEIWRVPLRVDVRPTTTARLPRSGWIVPPAWAALVGEKLRLHRILFQRADALPPELAVEVWRATKASPAEQPKQGRQPVALEGSWGPERRTFGPGALYVPAAQSNALLAAILLDPASPDSLLAAGFMNGVFERAEDIEGYVLEPWAREQLARDPALRAEWEARLEDPAFAKDPAARKAFFYRRHPAYDRAYLASPVVRVDGALGR